MKASASLCYNSQGLINTDAVEYIEKNNINKVVLFTDGSEEALERLVEHVVMEDYLKGKTIGLGKVPLYELRVVNQEGHISSPNYVYDEKVKLEWLCAKVCAPHLNINMYKKNERYQELTRKQIENICYLSYKLFNLINTAENRLAFPAVILDRLAPYTYYLTPETMNIKEVREKTGLHSLEYNSDTLMLTIDILGDVSTVKITLLNDLYGELILPFFNKLYGRKVRIDVKGNDLTCCPHEFTKMTYWELGRLVESMRIGSSERKITTTSLIESSDLIKFAKKVEINDTSCLWLDGTKTIQEVIEENKSLFVRGDHVDVE